MHTIRSALLFLYLMINAVNSIVATERKMQLDHHIDSLLRTANLKSNRSWTKGYRYLSHSDSVRWQNSYIVKLVPDITAMEFDEFAQVLDAAGCRIIHKLDNVFHGYVIRTENGALPKSVLHRVSEFIETIEEDHIVGTGSSNSNRVQELPKKGFWGFLLRVPAKLWGLDRIDQPYLSPDKRYHYNSTGKGVNVYVVDSGVNFHHAEFEGRAEIVFTSQTLGHSGDGHGSHVSGIIAGKSTGVAKGANIKMLRVMNCSGMSPVSEIVVAVDWIVANHVKPAVINLSIQLIHFHAERLAAEEIQVSEMLDQSISKALATGIPVVSAAGNSNVNACNLPPSKIPGVIAVAASDYKDNRASFSNHGPCISLFAPGVDILSVNARGGYAYGSGTSQAAPFVAGAVALYLETHSRASPAEIMQVLKGSAVSGVIKNPKDIPNLLLQTSFKNMTTTLQSFETYREQSKMWIVIGGSVVGVVAVGIFVLALVRSRDRQTTQANPRV